MRPTLLRHLKLFSENIYVQCDEKHVIDNCNNVIIVATFIHNAMKTKFCEKKCSTK